MITDDFLMGDLAPFRNPKNVAAPFRVQRAKELDRAADLELALGRHRVAERLARIAEELREEMTP
jgi:hypothetical protein